MQCKNDLNVLEQEYKLSRNKLDISVQEDACLPVSQHVLKVQNDDYNISSKVSPFKNLFSPNKINYIEKQASDLPTESLSQGTRNFLIELASSKTSKTSNESESLYALSTIKSPFKEINKNREVIIDSNEIEVVSECVNVSENSDNVLISNDNSVTMIKDDLSMSDNTRLSFLNDEKMSVTTNKDANVSDTNIVSILNEQSVSTLDEAQIETDELMSLSNDLNNITNTKDVENALDLIEQSSLHDREMSSAEICSSLNPIFSESNVVFSTSADSKLESNQVVGTNIDYETITLQTIDSNVENITNVETNTINLADLYSTNNSDLHQKIVLVQDESGNIETVLLLPEDAQLVESIPSYEVSASEPMILLDNNGENITKNTEIQTGQNIFVNNDSADKLSDQVQNVLIMQDTIDNSNKSVIAEKTINESQHETNVADSVTERKALIPESIFITNNDSLEMKCIEEKNVCAKDFLNHFEENILIDQKIDFVNVPSSHKITATVIDSNNGGILPETQMTTNAQTEQEVQKKCPVNLASNEIEMQNIISTALKRGCEEISNAVTNFNNNDISIIEEKFNADNDYISSNEHEKKSSITINNDNIDMLNLSKNSSVNSVADVSDSDTLTGTHISSKAKKRFSVNGTNHFIKFDQYIQPLLDNTVNIKANDAPVSTTITVNGVVCFSQPDTVTARNNSNSDSSDIRQFHESQLLKKKSLQKSKKTIVNKLTPRTAKKTVQILKENNDLYQIYQLLKNTDSALLSKIFENDEYYIKTKNILLEAGLKDEVIDHLLKRKGNSKLDSTLYNKIVHLNGVSKEKSCTVALKTFVKPFTAAKKSIFDFKKKLKNSNTALKTFMSRGSIMKNTALKTFSSRPVESQGFLRNNCAKKVSSVQNQQNINEFAKSYFQPEICEIKILPNEYVKKASDVLLKTNSIEHPSTPEENVSEEEIKDLSERRSPMEELMLPKLHCSCTEKETPCLCYDNNIQRICEAEDTFDDKVIPCKNHVSQHYLSTPSFEIKHRAFCDMHIWRLRRHHCCPKCGIFCSQGDFLLCSFEALEKKENHLFHLSCFLIPYAGLPPSCPHCCQFSNFTTVNLIYKSASDEEQKEVPSNAQNITSEVNGCDIYLEVKQGITTDQPFDSDIYVPQKNIMQLMIRSLVKENSFRLRPTAKCLYNPIKTGDVQKVMHLIGNGVDLNHKFKMHGNNSPLHVAAQYGWTGILHILIQAGAYIDSVNDDLETPLVAAVEKNQLPIVRYLILAGAQIDVKDCNGMTSFHIASKNGFKEIAQFLYSTGNIDINLQDDGGWTAVVWACEHKHVDFVRWLLEIGADPNVRDNEGNTVLHWAAYSGKYEIAQLLLDKGCTLSYVNKRGDSALHIAAREDNYECVKLFINRGAVLDQKNKENQTPLMCSEDDSLSFNYLLQSISSGALKIGILQLEKHVVFRDISRGAEAYPIQAINEVDDEEFIMEFRYVVKQCHRSGVNIISTVNNMQFCYCKDNCITRDCNCTMNSKCWYDANGCLTSECDLQSSPLIFECNKTCHCPKTCINRVVQQGLRFPLQIFRTHYKGWGVRALQDIPKGAFVCEYVGELITGAEATQRSDDTYLFDLESQEADYCLDGRYFGNVARFLNHSCEPNLTAIKVFVNHQDMNFPRIAFFAYKEIQAFEELCFDYGLDFWIVKCQSILCVCNTQSCKYSKDTIDDTLWRYVMGADNEEQLNCES